MATDFPIIPDRNKNSTVAPHPMSISWATAELAYSVYVQRHGDDQSLERMAERGGFGAIEMDMFLPDWREREENMRMWSVVIRAIDSYHELGQGTCPCPGHVKIEKMRQELPVFEDPNG